MGIKLNKAIGYGMPYSRFVEKTLLPINKSDYAFSDEVFMAVEEALTDTKDIPFCAVGPITDSGGLLDLITFAGNCDAVDHVIFYPTIGWEKRWHHRDNDVDYVFASGHVPLGDWNAFDLPSEFTYLPKGIYPFANLRMDADGKPVERPKDDDWGWERDPTLLPGIPEAMRHYMTTYGIFDLSGIADLRPIRGMWWG
jgi:hypothetical protein